MEQVKALWIIDVEKEPRTFEITSKHQMRWMEVDQHFELDLQDMEGYGNVYALLTYQESSQEAIDHAIKHGATINDMWVLRNLNNLLMFKLGGCMQRTHNEEEELIESVLRTFFDSCQHFSLRGDHIDHSYARMYEYETYTAIFSLKEDATLFEALIELLQSSLSLEEKERKANAFLEGRTESIIECRFKMDFE